MGWLSVTCSAKEARRRTTLQLLRDHSSYYVGATWGDDKFQCVVESLQIGGGGAYGVVARTEVATGDVVRFGLVILTFRKTQDGYTEFGWKSMDEFAGPYESGMAPSQFKRLSSLAELAAAGIDCRYAVEWRQRVKDQHEFKDNLNRLVLGTRILFEEPVSFADGLQIREFEFIGKTTGGIQFRLDAGDTIYRTTMTHKFLRSRKFSILS